MMKNHYVIAYDIRDNRRLKRIHYYISKHAKALQKSVFLAESDGKSLEKLIAGLRRRANDHLDDIRVYPVMHLDRIWAAGRQADKVRGLFAAPTAAPKKSLAKRLIGSLFGRAKP